MSEEDVVLPDDDDDAGADYPHDRAADIAERPLSPGTLAGSYFMSLDDGEINLHGMIVAEVQGGVYLLQLYGWDPPTRHHQILYKLPSMIEEGADWRFFDTEEDLITAEEGLRINARAIERG